MYAIVATGGKQYRVKEGEKLRVEKLPGRADKVKIIKFRRRKHHRKQMGHRQSYTEIEITGITA